MALRCLLKKMPALAVRSTTGVRSATGAIRGPLHELSPSAGSRLMSTVSLGRPTNLARAEGRELPNLLNESPKKSGHDMLMQEMADFRKELSRDLDDFSRSMNIMDKVLNAWIASVFAVPPALLLISITGN